MRSKLNLYTIVLSLKVLHLKAKKSLSLMKISKSLQYHYQKNQNFEFLRNYNFSKSKWKNTIVSAEIFMIFSSFIQKIHLIIIFVACKYVSGLFFLKRARKQLSLSLQFFKVKILINIYRDFEILQKIFFYSSVNFSNSDDECRKNF